MKDQEEKNMSLRIVYRDSNDGRQEVVLPFEDGEYKENLSYRENIQDAVTSMAEQGGFWLNKTVIIPYHRVLAVLVHNVDQPVSKKEKKEDGNQTSQRSNAFQKSRSKRRINTGPKNVQG